MGADAAVQVAVRIRPFNGREVAMNAKRCIDMEGSNTMISRKMVRSRLAGHAVGMPHHKL
jgi:hypothetical protein